MAKIDEQMIRANQLNVRRNNIVGEFCENSEFGKFDLQPDLLTSVTFTLKILLLTVHISHENISVIIS